MTGEENLKRISLMVKASQYESLSELGLNISGLVRDLIDDHLSHHKITIAVSVETRALYDRIVSNTGTADAEIERYFRDGLRALLGNRIAEMKALEEEAFGSASRIKKESRGSPKKKSGRKGEP